MSEPIEITDADLFAEIGRLYVENKALRGKLAQTQARSAAGSNGEAPPDEPALRQPTNLERTP